MMDLVLSLLLIAGVLSWLFPFLALLIRLDSKGPILFRQKRVGRRGRVFTCLKFRTMRVNPQADEQPAAEQDPRVTRLGAILRRTHLDELPQLLNVMTGSMSLVGPRPYMLSDNSRFARLVPNHGLRETVKPGITGLAQVHGFHGPVADPEALVYRWQWDAFYVRHSSLMMDLRILQETIRLFLTQKETV